MHKEWKQKKNTSVMEHRYKGERDGGRGKDHHLPWNIKKVSTK